jgi:hypothetical protein
MTDSDKSRMVFRAISFDCNMGILLVFEYNRFLKFWTRDKTEKGRRVVFYPFKSSVAFHPGYGG